jgi:hypothetical protein
MGEDWIEPEEMPLARAWAEHEVLARDAYDATQMDPGNEKLLLAYLRVRNAQLTHAKALGLTPTDRIEDIEAASRSYRR